MYPRARKPCTKALVTGSIGSGPAITERGAVLKKYPTRYTLITCCALAANGHVVAALPISPINSRRFMSAPKAQDKASYRVKMADRKGCQMSALGQKQTVRCKMSCLLYPRESLAPGDVINDRILHRPTRDRRRGGFRRVPRTANPVYRKARRTLSYQSRHT